MNLHRNIRVALAYKNFAANRHISHIGLGVTATNTAKVLRQNGVYSDVWPIVDCNQLATYVARGLAQDPPLTHVVISAPWIPVLELQRLLLNFPLVEFAVLSHSNVGFLQADTRAIEIIRQLLGLETANLNFHFGGNSRKFCEWIEHTYQDASMWLPNLYFLDHTAGGGHRPTFHGSGVLRIGSFGAMRPLKNFMSAAGAALEIASRMRADLEFWISTGRNEGSQVNTILSAVRAMYKGVHYAKLVENCWETWPEFRNTVAHMHLLLAPSYSESFHVVTSDGIAEGVPSVVSDAIDWVPDYWRAPADNVSQIANVGVGLIANGHAIEDGLNALREHNREGIHAWREFLRGSGVQRDQVASFTQ